MEPDRILGRNGQSICKALSNSELMAEFYLAGGTGLALQLGHRKSFDLDFFQKGKEERIRFSEISREINRLFGVKRASLEFKQIDQVIWSIDGVKVTFLAYPFPLVYPLVPGGSIAGELDGIFLASQQEIALMKAYALGRLATFRDHIDLYFLLHHQIITLGDIIQEAASKFIIDGERVFSGRLFLEQLAYTQDVEDKEASINLVTGEEGISHIKVERFLKTQVQHFLDRHVMNNGGSAI